MYNIYSNELSELFLISIKSIEQESVLNIKYKIQKCSGPADQHQLRGEDSPGGEGGVGPVCGGDSSPLD